MTEKESKELLNRFLRDECTHEEKERVQSWYYSMANDDPDYTGVEDFEAVSKRILHRIGRKEREKHLRRLVAACAALICVTAAAYFYMHYSQVTTNTYVTVDIAPGGNKAMLTLAGGKTIRLDELAVGSKTDAGDMIIEKTADGKIQYRKKDNASDAALTNAINTVTTPKGGQYQVILPDGTKVWLNAASKLTYPVSFAGKNKREVTLNGEAYFEVFKDKHHPFLVESVAQLITVTGTHFHVSCYLNEPTLTTLAEGSVVVQQHNTLKMQPLKPGQQSILNENGLQVVSVNPDDFVSWKDGNFVFVHTPIRQMLSQLSRWYNVEVDYSNLPEKYFDGDFSRNVKLSELLKRMEDASNVKFVLEGRRISIR